MKWILTLYMFVFLLPVSKAQVVFSEDILKQGFESVKITMPDDYDGKVIATLIRKKSPGNKRAVLYIHGFSDYFFQVEMANQFLANGYDFYAIDLRKYGRSILPNHRPFNVRNIHEYDADIDTALSIIHQSDYKLVLLNGHSTGGLIASCYAHKNRGNEKFNALFLNSPFFDMNLSKANECILVPSGAFYGKINPKAVFNKGVSSLYGYSIHRSYHGDWEFDTIWKPISSPAVNYGWVNAIHQAHKEVQKGNITQKPVLIFSSSRTVYAKQWNPSLLMGDFVLDVKDIEKYGRKLGPHVTYIQINNAIHDIFLSSSMARMEAYGELFSWLTTQFP